MKLRYALLLLLLLFIAGSLVAPEVQGQTPTPNTPKAECWTGKLYWPCPK